MKINPINSLDYHLGKIETLNEIEDELCYDKDIIVIRAKDVPEEFAGYNLEWLDKEVCKIKKRIKRKLKEMRNRK